MVIKLAGKGKKVKYLYSFGNLKITEEESNECENIFTKLEKYLQKKKLKKKNGLIILTGNLIKKRNNTTINDLMLLQNFLKRMSKIMPVIIILGKTDINPENLQDWDVISPIVMSMESNNIYLLRESGEYAYGNLLFTVKSILNKHITSIKKKKGEKIHR